MHSMAWLVQLAQFMCSEQGFLQDERVLWLGFPANKHKITAPQNSYLKVDLACGKWVSVFLTCSFLTDETKSGCSARIGLQARRLRLLQIGTETRVTGLPRQPVQAAVCEGSHVLPTPVWHIDLPQAHPGGQPLWRQQQKKGAGDLNSQQNSINVLLFLFRHAT